MVASLRENKNEPLFPGIITASSSVSLPTPRQMSREKKKGLISSLPKRSLSAPYDDPEEHTNSNSL